MRIIRDALSMVVPCGVLLVVFGLAGCGGGGGGGRLAQQNQIPTPDERLVWDESEWDEVNWQ